MKKKIKIILLEDIPNLGHKYETAEVALGYFRNKLAPEGKAEVATDQILNQLEEERKKAKEEKEKRIKRNKKRAEDLKNKEFVFEVKTGEKDQVYGSVSVDDISDKLNKEGYEDVSINLSDSIKELGETQVWVEFGDDIRTPISVVLKKE